MYKFCHITILSLVPNYTGHIPLNLHIPYRITNQPALHISRKNHDAAAVLQPDRHEIAILVHRKLPRVRSPSGPELMKRQRAIRIQRKRRERVRQLARRVLRIRIRDAERRVIAIRDDEKPVIGRDSDFSGGRARRLGAVAAVRLRRVHLLEGQTPGCGIGDRVGGHGLAELGHDVQEGGAVGAGYAVGRPEDAVSWPGAGHDFERGLRGDEAGGGVEAEDADEVGAQVRDEDELAGGIQNGFVRVGSVLSGGVGAWLRESEEFGL